MSTGADDARVSVFLPCRLGSERVPLKNVRPFAGRPHGLLQVKLEQLLSVPSIDEIVVSSNDPAVLDYAASLGSPRVRVHRRDDALGSSSTSTDALVAHALALIPGGHILWTHVTSPFFTAQAYDAAIAAYRAALAAGTHDSLMSVNTLHSFLWTAEGPMNYDRRVERWPRTQTLAPVYDINSAVFLHSCAGYRRLDDRIGERPLLWPSEDAQGFDIDWPQDFRLAEAMAASGYALD